MQVRMKSMKDFGAEGYPLHRKEEILEAMINGVFHRRSQRGERDDAE